MSQKERVLHALAMMPDDSSFEDIMEKLRFLAAVQEGLDAVDRGETVDHEVIEKKLASWVSA
jgi:predicted transcriptional regulator